MPTDRATISSVFLASARAYPDNLAVVFEDERATYAELEELSAHIAESLVEIGVGQRDRVGYFMHNSVDLVATLLAIARVGAASVPVSIRLRGEELRNVLAGHRIAALITHRAFESEQKRLASRLAECGADAVTAIHDIETMRAGSSAARAEVRLREHETRVRDIGLVLPTSGTTSVPKGCLLTHEAFVGPGLEMAHVRFLLRPGERLWDPLPLFHLGGLTPLVACLGAGAAWVGLRHFTPEQAIRQLADERCVVAYSVFEPLWLPVVDHPGFDQTALCLREVHAVGPYERLVHYQQAHPRAAITSSYGTSEGAPASYTTPDDPPAARLHTVGRQAPGTRLRIVDPDTGADAAPMQSGEIVYHGWQLFEGHLVDGEVSTAMLDVDGWLHSGDGGFLDPDGYLHFTGRIKDMLKVGGENVAAAEIEVLLMGLPGVATVQVVGAPDAKYTEVAAAFVERAGGSELTESQVIEWCQGKIAGFKVPRHVRFVAPGEWPMSATKVQKAVLRSQIAAELRAVAPPAP
jgi:fatty-acyl-CoA synthase